MAQELKKLMIKNEDTSEVFSVLFNPTDYSIEDASNWSDQTKMGQKPELHYTGGARKKLTMELFFDTHESKTDVRKHTGKIAKLLEYNKDKHRPPKVTISWGNAPPKNVPKEFPSTVVLQSLKQQFILFMGDGTPVRAKLSVVFLEFTLPKEELKKKDKKSADHTKTYLVKVGDTLSGIAGLFYKDPRLWRPIAKENNVPSPRKLEPGQRLTIPRIEPQEQK
jgi:LysM repeat protein